MSGNCLNHSPGIVSTSSSFLSLDPCMRVRSWTCLCSKVLVEELVSGLDEPFLADEVLTGRVLHPIVASINATVKPLPAIVAHKLLQVDHRGFLPTSTWMCPLKVDLTRWIILQRVLDEVIHVPQHTALPPLICLQKLLSLISGIVDESPLAVLGAGQTEPNLPRFGSFPKTLHVFPGLLLVEVIPFLQVDATRSKSLLFTRLTKPAVRGTSNFPDTIAIIQAKIHQACCQRRCQSSSHQHQFSSNLRLKRFQHLLIFHWLSSASKAWARSWLSGTGSRAALRARRVLMIWAFSSAVSSWSISPTMVFSGLAGGVTKSQVEGLGLVLRGDLLVSMNDGGLLGIGAVLMVSRMVFTASSASILAWTALQRARVGVLPWVSLKVSFSMRVVIAGLSNLVCWELLPTRGTYWILKPHWLHVLQAPWLLPPGVPTCWP